MSCKVRVPIHSDSRFQVHGITDISMAETSTSDSVTSSAHYSHDIHDVEVQISLEMTNMATTFSTMSVHTHLYRPT